MGFRTTCLRGLGLCLVLVFLFQTAMVEAALFGPRDFRMNGWIREYASVNLDDFPETVDDEQGEFSMLRTSLYLEADADLTDWLELKAIGRIDQEVQTDVLKNLQNGPFDPNAPATTSGSGAGAFNLESEYEDSEIRELYFDVNLTDRIDMRLGRQQVVWGKTDFFQALDVVHGFDFRWRNFLEAENEQLRKPLWIANTFIEFPEYDGTLQLVYRPGYGDEEQIGHSYDIRGGRWGLQPNRGFDFEVNPSLAVPENFNHPEGDADDGSFGFRWFGTAFQNAVEYSVVYWHGHHQDPVVNSAAQPYKGTAPQNGTSEFIFPQVNIFGGSFNYYYPTLDIVVRGEAAYTIDKPYNFGSAFSFPGFGGIIEKDSLKLMMNFDRQVDFAEWMLGADRPGFLSVQIFDEWIVDHKDSDQIVDLAGYSAPQDEHSVIVTGILGWNYMADRVNPQLALIWDASNKDWMYIPSVSFVYGNHWRLTLEADIFDPSDSTPVGGSTDDTHILGYFDNADQFYARLEYQF